MEKVARDVENVTREKVIQHGQKSQMLREVRNIIREKVWADENEKGWKGILGFKYGIIQAPLGPDISSPELVAAVANAGCLGFVRTPDADDPDYTRKLIREVRKRTKERFGVGIILPFPYTENLKVILDEKVAFLETHGGDVPKKVVDQAHAAGTKVLAQIGRIDSARKAMDAGVDGIIVQSIEAGGNLVGEESSISLLPMVVDLVKGSGIPVISAGGIADARGYIAALSLGAHGVSIGTRFAATDESDAHPLYKKNLVDLYRTEYTNIYGRRRWPNMSQRTLTVDIYRKVLPSYETEEGQPIIGHSIIHGVEKDIPRYGGMVPNRRATGDIKNMPMYAGQGVGLIKEILPASEVIKRIITEAQELTIQTCLTSLYD